MNDAMTANQKEELSKEAGIVELGSVSEETKGLWDGELYDGGAGWFG